MNEVTLEFIARQLERVLFEQADTHDHLRIINARLTGIEVAIDSLQRQLERMNSRIHKLKDARK